jgi:hypothetical protein
MTPRCPVVSQEIRIPVRRQDSRCPDKQYS